MIISPYDLDSLSLSDPAKSTNENLPYLLIIYPPELTSPIKYAVNIEWDLDESLFNSCEPYFLFFIPSCKTAYISDTDVHSTIIKSSTKKPFYKFHLQCNIPDAGFNKSLNYSLYISVNDALT